MNAFPVAKQRQCTGLNPTKVKFVAQIKKKLYVIISNCLPQFSLFSIDLMLLLVQYEGFRPAESFAIIFPKSLLFEDQSSWL